MSNLENTMKKIFRVFTHRKKHINIFHIISNQGVCRKNAYFVTFSPINMMMNGSPVEEESPEWRFFCFVLQISFTGDQMTNPSN